MSKILSILILVLAMTGCTRPRDQKIEKVILISANAEWNVVKSVYSSETIFNSHWGEYFIKELKVGNGTETVIFFHGGWGKVAAAGSAQYCIDQWAPRYIFNLGTCGGFEGAIKKFEIVLVDKTVIYDIAEAMGDSQQAIKDYTTEIDLSWLGGDYPTPVTKTLLVSADKDIVPSEIPKLKADFKAIAADWESGAIAYACSKNNQRLVILRGVTDLVNEQNGEAYHNEGVFVQGTEVVMKKLLEDLPLWLAKCP